MINKDYRVTTLDYDARYLCEQNGFECEAVPSHNSGNIRIAISKNGELVKIKIEEYKYLDSQYAVYKTYKALAYRIINK